MSSQRPRARINVWMAKVDTQPPFTDRLNAIGENGARVELERYFGDSIRRPNADPRAPLNSKQKRALVGRGAVATVGSSPPMHCVGDWLSGFSTCEEPIAIRAASWKAAVFSRASPSPRAETRARLGLFRPTCAPRAPSFACGSRPGSALSAR